MLLIGLAMVFCVVPYALFMFRRSQTPNRFNGHTLYLALAGSVAAQLFALHTEAPALPVILVAEILKHAAIIGWLSLNIRPFLPGLKGLHLTFAVAVTAPLCLLAWPFFAAPPPLWAMYIAFGFLLLSLTQAVFVERFAGLLSKHKHTGNAPLIIALSVLTGFDFLLACQFVINGTFVLDSLRWQAFAIILAAPFLWRGIGKLQVDPIRIALSRPLVFHGSLFAIAGAYLLLVSGLTYGMNKMGWALNSDTQLAIAAVLILPLSLVMLSPKARGEIRVWINKHLFAAQYDYRETWLGLLEQLKPSLQGKAAHRTALAATLDAMQAQSGAYLVVKKGRLSEQVIQGFELSPSSLSFIQRAIPFFNQHNWIIDTREALSTPQAYPGLTTINKDDDIAQCRWLVPVERDGVLVGVLILGHSGVNKLELNWETRDFLFALAQQMAGYIESQDTQQRLSESAQFAAFNQTSAFVIHDMKNIRAQLAMLNENGQVHRSNPEFIDDAFETIESMLGRMDKMLGQLTNKQFIKPTGPSKTVILDLLEEVAGKPEWRDRPVPHIQTSGTREATLTVDRDKLENVLHHLIDNAQHAMKKTTHPKLELACDIEGECVTIRITDNGCGMDSDFVEKKLFHPFETTKGNAGMGIGVYDAKNFIASLNGQISVNSQPGNGTQFILNVPRSGHDTTNC